ncbi:MAG: zinc-ribbon domain-containing protein [Candidatus Mcinerneyibacterium aminivorans]|uniref:Zinc-ribbon domain-containing protein n=1 Tax=Candidatus Mcinerneyibacterium aminivorans TaxID=2703815 RepID=A0A5D0MDZ5_9BACT|nr:MAG: zinc-ribbon domain-containing protein [Candidatus Mcinerneyibacterium aminivorans]
MAFFMCPQCGADIDLTDTNKCEFCGYELNMSECVECGKEIPVDSNVCPYCDAEQGEIANESLEQASEVEMDTDIEAEQEEDQFLSDIESAIESDIPSEDQEIESDESLNQISEEETDIDNKEESQTEFVQIEDDTSDMEQMEESFETKGSSESIDSEKEQKIQEELITSGEEPTDLEAEEESYVDESEEEIEAEKDVISNVTGEETFDETETDEELDFGHREEIEEIIEEPGIQEDLIEDEEEEFIQEEDEYLESLDDIELGAEEESHEKIYDYEEEELTSEDLEESTSDTEETVSAEERTSQKDKDKDKEEQVCPECEAKNPAMAKFCLNCGAKLQVPEEEEKKNICPECGTENLEDARFCMVCGTSLSAEKEIKEKKMETPLKKESPKEDKKQYKVKIKYDKDNKFKYRFVKNKIKGIKTVIDEKELETLMSNNNFVVSIPVNSFRDFKMELEELDCSVERIDKSAETSETKQAEKEEYEEVTKNYVEIKELPEKTEQWQSKFVSMLSAMRPDITDEEAEKISKGAEKRIEVKNKEDGQQLAKVLSALNCETEVIEGKEKIKKEPEEEIHKKEETDSAGKKKEEKDIEKEIEQEMKARMKTQEGKKQEETETKPEEQEKKEEEKPKFLILSGVDKNNWVVRERLLEKLVKMYPNMTRDIAEGIVTQPVVKLRVKNMEEAQKYKPEFEDMGWNTRIEDVAKMLKARKSKRKSNVNVEKRKQIHQAYLKREKSKRRNILTTILIAIFVIGIGYFLYSSFFVSHDYMLVEAEVGHNEVELSTSGEPVVHLRKNPRMDSQRVGVPIQIGSVLELERNQPIQVGGYSWFEVKVPGIRGRTGYIRGDIVIPSDKNGNPVSESP